MTAADNVGARLTDLSIGEGTLLISGDAGMGKTHALRRAAASVIAAGGRVGWCQCNRALGGPPLWEWLAAIGELDDDLPPGFPGHGGLEVFQSVWRWLEDRGQERPTLLVLDDLHDASPFTIELLDHVGRRPRSASWLIVAAARPDLIPAGDLQIVRQHLDGVDADDVGAMASHLGIDMSAERAAELVGLTGGNPLFVRRVLESGGSDFDMTPELLASMRPSIEDIDDEVRPLAEALSVLGTSAEESLVRRVADSGDLSTSVASDRTILVENGELVFRHPLVREVVYEHLSDARRSELHGRAAELIESTGGSTSLAALHWSRAAMSAQGRQAADTALRAGHLAMDMEAWTEAIDHFAHAGAVLGQLDRPDDVLASAVVRARAFSLDGDVLEAMRVLDAAAQTSERVSLESRQLLVRELTRLRWREEPNPSQLSGGTLQRIAGSVLGDEDDAVSVAVRACLDVAAGEIDGLRAELAEEVGAAMTDLPVEVPSVVRGEVCLALRRALMAVPLSFDERSAASAAAVVAAREAGDVELLGRALRMELADAMTSGDRSVALGTIAAFDTAATSALREHQALAQSGLAAIEGRYDDAADLLDGAAKELSYVGRESPSLDFVRVAFIALDRGGFAEGLAVFEPLLAVVADPSLRAAFAYAAALDDDRDRACDLIDGVIELLDTNQPDPLRPVSIAMAAEAAVLVDHPRCAWFADALEPMAGTCTTPSNAAIPWLGSVDRLIGLLRARRGDLSGAEAALRTSVAVHRRMQARPWEARSLAGLAAVLHASGRGEEAATCDEQSSTIVRELSMAPLPFVDLEDSQQRATPSVDATRRRARLEQIDKGWLLGLGDDAGVQLRNLNGLGQLARLLDQPGREWHALDLVGGEAARVDAGDAGPILDDDARADYQNRMAHLRQELDDATAGSDLERAASITLEIDALESELLAAFGLGGRSRRLDDGGERARVNVRRSLARAIEAIEAVDAGLGDHLRHRVVTGRFCSYRPAVSDPITWDVVR